MIPSIIMKSLAFNFDPSCVSGTHKVDWVTDFQLINSTQPS